MGKIYRNQTYLVIRVSVGTPLAGVSEALIKCRKPDGTTQSFPALVVDKQQGILEYSPTEDDLDQVGLWTLWAYLTFADGREIAGEPETVRVYAEGF